MSLASYRYASTVLITSAAIVFVLFGLIQASSIRFKVNATQPLLTLSLSLLILSYIARVTASIRVPNGRANPREIICGWHNLAWNWRRNSVIDSKKYIRVKLTSNG